LSAIVAIRYESELIREFHLLLASERDFRWKTPERSGVPSTRVEVELAWERRRLRFCPIFSLSPSIPEIEALHKDSRPTDAIPLLVVPRLSPRILDFCRKNRRCALDLSGRLHLCAEGLLVDRGPLPNRNFRFEQEPRNVFVGKSARIVRTLLTDRDHTWIQRELVSRTQASPGLVSRIVKHLLQQGYLEKTGVRQYRLRDSLALLDAWAGGDRFARRASTTRYSAFGKAPLEVAGDLRQLAASHNHRIAFTQWIAGWLRRPYTEPTVISAYVSAPLTDALLEKIGLRAVAEAGNVWLHVPDDEGVFLETRVLKELPLVTDAQVYLDLQGTGLRGPDQAAALREWQGFCRP
jgi:hypothetical protein